MDYGQVRKSAAASAAARVTIVIEDVLSTRLVYSSSFVLLEDSTSAVARPLLAFLQRSPHACQIEASALQKFPADPLEEPHKLYLVKDATVELCQEAPHAAAFIRRLSQVARQLAATKRTLIVDIQRDVLSPQTVAALEYISETVVAIDSNLPTAALFLSVSHRLAGGKMKQEQVIYEQGRFTSMASMMPAKMTTPPSALPISTFNMALTAEQAAAKANVILPHMRVQLGQMSIGQSAPNILAGDYDEEDPDDDLEV